jgi:signal peptidase complex subunit 2
VPIYHLTITVQEKGAGGKGKEIRIVRPFREWFDKEGHFVTIPFQQMLASNVGVIGAADPKRVAEEKEMGAGAKADDTKSMEEKWNSLLAESSGATVVDSKVEADAASSATPGKRGKRRAKKA